MDENQQQKAIDALRDWSKWLIGLNFLAGVGCVTVLQVGVKGPPRPWLLAAIAAFVVATVCSAFLVRVLASLVEHLPMQDESDNLVSIYDYKVYRGVSVKSLSHLQLGITCIGGLCLLAWVLLKPPPSPANENPQPEPSAQVDQEFRYEGAAAAFGSFDQAAVSGHAVEVLRIEFGRSPQLAEDRDAERSLLQHPPGPHGDKWQIVLDWIHEPDLKWYLADRRRSERARRPSTSETLRLFRGLAHGLSQLHRRGIFHGDVHPGNLILTTNPTRIVPIDFGSAWQAERTLSRAEGDGMHAAYAAPEIQNGAGFVDFRSDQFSATVILYELLTLSLPYDGLGGKAGRPELAATMATSYNPPSRLNLDRGKLPRRVWQEIDRLAATALEFAPAGRCPTPSAWLHYIEQVFRGLQPPRTLSSLGMGITPAVAWLTDRIRRR